MELEIRPDPAPEERRAIDEAVARLLAEQPEPRSQWWREGVRESVTSEEEPA